jgi:hypothetical protein
MGKGFIGSLLGAGGQQVIQQAQAPAGPTDAEVRAAEEEERKAAGRRRGRSSTIVGGLKGSLLSGAGETTTGLKDLLGR